MNEKCCLQGCSEGAEAVFPEKEALKRTAAIFKALSHPTRLKIVLMLAEGELCVCVFQEMFGVDFSTVSRHLSVLKNAGIVSDEKRGKNVFYRLEKPCILGMYECLRKE